MRLPGPSCHVHADAAVARAALALPATCGLERGPGEVGVEGEGDHGGAPASRAPAHNTQQQQNRKYNE